MLDDPKVQARIQREQTKWEQLDQKDRDDALRAFVQHKQGRKYIEWLLSVGNAWGAEQELFTGNALSTAFQCGQQNVGKQVMAHLMEVAPDGFLTMLKERMDERNSRTSRIAALAAGVTAATPGGTEQGANGGEES